MQLIKTSRKTWVNDVVVIKEVRYGYGGINKGFGVHNLGTIGLA